MNEPLDSMELARVAYQTVMGHLRLNPRWDDICPEARKAWEAGALKVASVILEVIEEHGRRKAETSIYAAEEEEE